mgnify:FL=1
MTDAKARKLLEKIFGCNADEFDILERTSYDIKDLVADAIEYKQDIPNIDDLVQEILIEGQMDISNYVDDKCLNLEYDGEEIKYLEKLDNLMDFQIVCDKEKSYLNIKQNTDIYKSYLMEIIKKTERKMGFPIYFNVLVSK